MSTFRAVIIAALVLCCLYPGPTAPASPQAAQPAAPNADAELVKTAQGMLKDLRAHTLDNGLRVYLLPVKGSPVVTRDGRLQGRQRRRGEGPDRPVALPRTPHVQGHRQAHARRHRPRHAAQRRAQQRLHHRGHDRLSLRLRRRPLAERARHRGRPHAKPPHRREARVRAGEGGRHRGTGRQRGRAVGPRIQGDSAAAVPEGFAVLASGHRRARARPRCDRRDHQAALRQVVSPEQRVARRSSAASTRTRRWRRSRSCSARSPRANCRRASPRPRSRTATARFARSSNRSSTCRGCSWASTRSPSARRTIPSSTSLQHILADGKTSRLYRKLVEDERIATGVDAGNYAGRYPGWFAVSVDLLEGEGSEEGRGAGLRGTGETGRRNRSPTWN